MCKAFFYKKHTQLTRLNNAGQINGMIKYFSIMTKTEQQVSPNSTCLERFLTKMRIHFDVLEVAGFQEQILRNVFGHNLNNNINLIFRNCKYRHLNQTCTTGNLIFGKSNYGN